jgi:hypothetical protein
MQEIFHKLLRPELVYKNTVPLSSDAFRYSSILAPIYFIHILEVASIELHKEK